MGELRITWELERILRQQAPSNGPEKSNPHDSGLQQMCSVPKEKKLEEPPGPMRLCAFKYILFFIFIYLTYDMRLSSPTSSPKPLQATT